MEVYTKIEKELCENNNRIIGTPEQFTNSSIRFKGKNNTIFFSSSVKLNKSVFNFCGDNALVYICGSNEVISLDILIHNQSVAFIGNNLGTNEPLHIICSESKHVFIGNDCLISSCLIRTGDAHRLYDIETGMRLNEGKSVYFGDHIWIGAKVTVLKGSKIYSGCIIGSNSLLSGKNYYSKTAYAGNPAKAVRRNVAFDKRGTHGLTPYGTSKIAHLSEEELADFVYKKDDSFIDFDQIESFFNTESDANKRIAFLNSFQTSPLHNRFSLDEQ